jgi:nucleoid-associated protein YgaU
MSSPPPRTSLPPFVPWLVAGVLLFGVAAFAGFGAAYIVASANAVPTVDPALLPSPTPRPTNSRPPVSPTPVTSPTSTPAASPAPSLSPTEPAGASPSASSAPTPAATPISYVVKRGDTLSSIAAQFGVTWQSIVDLNHLDNPNHIEPGQVLLIPVP